MHEKKTKTKYVVCLFGDVDWRFFFRGIDKMESGTSAAEIVLHPGDRRHWTPGADWLFNPALAN